MIPRVSRFLLLAAAWVLAVSFASAIEQPIPSAPLLPGRYQISGSSEEAVIKEARARALRSAIGRIYFTDYMLRARSLLEAYVDRYSDNFVARQKVWTSEIRGGRRYMDIEVVVDCKKLYDDLNEKKFLYRPAFRPIFYLFLAETYNGQPVEDMFGRKHLLQITNLREYRYLWQDHPSKANDPSIPASQKTEVDLITISAHQDPTTSATELAKACREAQRYEIEVFVAGTIETKTVRNKEVYFDNYTYVETRCTLSLVRSDTGEILSTVSTTVSAAHMDPEEARRMATADALDKLAPQLFGVFDKQWDKMILRKADLRIMVIGLNDVAVNVLRQLITGISPEAEIYTRCSFADVGVLTVTWNGKAQDLLHTLRLDGFPSVRMFYVEPNGLILENI